MLSARIDSLLVGYSSKKRKKAPANLPTLHIKTPTGFVRVYDSGGEKPCVVFVRGGASRAFTNAVAAKAEAAALP